jgi:lauroyl/myristoyl acyltransferase
VGPAQLSVLSGAPIVPSFVYLIKGDRYRAVFEPPIYPDEHPDRDSAIPAITQRLADVCSEYIARSPSQWYNF